MIKWFRRRILLAPARAFQRDLDRMEKEVGIQWWGSLFTTMTAAAKDYTPLRKIARAFVRALPSRGAESPHSLLSHVIRKVKP